jgi:hypothetical protein
MALPISLTIRVRLPLRTRLALCAIFGLGGFIITFSVVRIVVTNTTHKRPELSWLSLWSSIEASVAGVVCNLAPFKVWFHRKKWSPRGTEPYRYNPRHAVEGKLGIDSHELSQQSDGPDSADYLKGPYMWFDPSKPRNFPPPGLRTHVTANHGPQDPGRPIRDGVIMVSRQVDRKETPSNQVTMTTESLEDDGRTPWQHASNSAEVILPPRRDNPMTIDYTTKRDYRR